MELTVVDYSSQMIVLQHVSFYGANMFKHVFSGVLTGVGQLYEVRSRSIVKLDQELQHTRANRVYAKEENLCDHILMN